MKVSELDALLVKFESDGVTNLDLAKLIAESMRSRAKSNKQLCDLVSRLNEQIEQLELRIAHIEAYTTQYAFRVEFVDDGEADDSDDSDEVFDDSSVD